MPGLLDEQLAHAARRIHDLEARGGRRSASQPERLRRRVEALRRELAGAAGAVQRTNPDASERVAVLASRLDVAERSLGADHAEDGCAFLAEVEAELHSWDRFAERLQTTAAGRTGRARDRAEAALTRLRGRRLAVAEHLDELRAAGRETWHERRARVTAARDDLEHLADHLFTSVF